MSRSRREPVELPEIRRAIIVDSGASQHMIGEKELHDSERATIRSVKDPFLIQTAHGIVPCDKEARIYVHDLNVWVWAGLLEDSPAVLSMGLLCKSMGFAFTWEEGAEYGFLTKGNKTIRCKTVCNVPTVSIATESESQEAEDSEEDEDESSDEGSSSESSPPKLESSEESSSSGCVSSSSVGSPVPSSF